ncbi:MAG: dihydropyrimidinase [Firmicutes bacterium]|nr:dihydropyrimidinase [Bacillota bacterium]MDH7496030.1 dihydropyrimidinase [Bacillota bacterium]
MDFLIRGGTVVTADGESRSDVAVDGGKIVFVGDDAPATPEAVVLDASGKYVLPGVIDAHTHFALRSRGAVTADDFASGTQAAASGGVTCVVDFADEVPGVPMTTSARARVDEAGASAAVDFALHMTVTKAPADLPREMAELARMGVGAVKLFTTYRSAGYLLEDADFLAVSDAASKAGLLVTVHAEDNDTVERLESALRAQARTSPSVHSKSRPPEAEAMAIRDVAARLGSAGIPVYFVHVSSAAGLDAVREARRLGYHVYAETCPHYLLLTQEVYLGDTAREFIMTPPLRTAADTAALWDAVLGGEIDVIATDHCAFTREQKTMGATCFDVLPGVPGVETLLPLVYHEGVVRRGMALPDMVRMLSYNPARLFGLYPRKGTIAPGSDADIVVFDPGCARTIGAQGVVSRAGYTPYEGMRVEGVSKITMVRGRVVWANGQFVGTPGWGRFVPAATEGLGLREMRGPEESRKG